MGVSLDEKETSVPALALTLALFQYPERDLNPHRHYCPLDFKSSVSTIPPSGQRTAQKHIISVSPDGGLPYKLAAR